MSKFEIRSPHGAGVAGFLQEQGTILFIPLHEMKKSGHVLDLLSISLETIGTEQRSLRQALFTLLSLAEFTKEAPYDLECGYDSSHLVFSMRSHELNLTEKSQETQAFKDLQKYFSWIVIKHNPVQLTRELILCTTLSMPKISSCLVESLTSESTDPPPAVARLIHLGDVSYEDLLRQKSGQTRYDRPLTGKILVPTFKIKGGEIPIDEEKLDRIQRIKMYQDQLNTLNKKLSAMQREKENEEMHVKSLDGKEKPEGAGGKVAGFLKNLFGDSDKKSEKPKPEEATVSAKKAESDAKQAAEKAEDLSDALEEAHSEIDILKKELKNSELGKRFDGLMQKVAAEKMQLKEASKAINQQMRQRELLFQNRESAYKQEIRKREELLRQKQTAIDQSKAQTSELMAKLENLKSSTASASEDGHLKQKYTQNIQMLTALKEEKNALHQKFEQLKLQHSALQNTIKGGKAPSSDSLELQTKLERSQKQVDEYRKQYQALLDRFKEKTNKETGPNKDEIKRRYDSALKMAAATKKEAEIYKSKFEDLKREELRLKMEVSKMTEENKALKASLARVAPKKAPGATGTGGKAAA